MQNIRGIKNKLNIVYIFLLSVLLCSCFSGCDYIYYQPKTSDIAELTDNLITSGEALYLSVQDELGLDENTDVVADSESFPSEKEMPALDESDFVEFDPEDSFSYCDQPVCLYDRETGLINYTINLKSIPKSDDLYIYLFEMSDFEDDYSFVSKPYVCSEFKDYTVTMSFDYDIKHLFSRFVPAIVYEKTFYPISIGQYITNPEDIAENTTPYPDMPSKKGILLDPMTVDKDELNSLNVKRVVYNIPLSFIMGETDNEACPTVEFDYLGKTYYFNGFMLNGFDTLFANLTENGFHITAIVLNDWNDKYPDIIHPLSRNKNAGSLYYAFNSEDESGVRLTEVAALFLAKRYSGGEYGLIQDWVIANEINQQKMWNYMATSDVYEYTEAFEKSFRIFYNAIKSSYSNANVFFSIDHDWNNNGGANYRFFNGKDVLITFNDIAKKHGNYNWGLSIHPYPAPLTKTRFWNGYYDKSESARVVTPMNLSVLTDFMLQDDMLDVNGNVRQIGVTELGFSSRAGERVQAAAFAYCYYIIDKNEYISSFLMNRQTDSYLSLESGLAPGIYNPDYSAKYIADVFANIDSEDGESYVPEMLEIIGASSLEEALSWAE